MTATLVVRLGGVDPAPLEAAASAAIAVAGDVDGSIALARSLDGPAPGAGTSAAYLSLLATIAAADLTTARVVEPHLDALAILGQAGLAPGAGVYGVYAAERPGLAPVRAGGGALTGTKPWCSLAGRLDRALVTAEQDGDRRLFDVDLRDPRATAVPGTWIARGLAAVDSGDLVLDAAPATPVGEAGWYLRRPGFAWGGIGVAACWFGGAVALADALLAQRREPDQLALVAIGRADRLLWQARSVLADAAARIDAGEAEGARGALLAERVRGVVADAAEQVLLVVGHALGPAPLAFDETHARRVADLTVYLRQHHAERDEARQGAAVREQGGWA
ncbi:acyl-CoA dehydrogenase [Amnibacterium endophyticum]|uniref:Acyl-CoA dehydrogenase n=1 Tax=Amnibacterium endophyticum TaxID=2109337 RepID=A0ABW4LA26_9MICO